MGFSQYIPLCNAIVLLLKPLIEIVIHDLSTDTIVYIEGELSKRQLDDSSLLAKDAFENDLNQIIYPKLNFDGRLIKSISIPLESRWLLCINCDVSIFSQMQRLSEDFVAIPQSSQPKSLFKHDWQEKMHMAVHGFINEKNWRFDALTQKQKKEVVHYLFQQGAFEQKNASDYIANTLGIGRATIFNYLKHWRQYESV